MVWAREERVGCGCWGLTGKVLALESSFVCGGFFPRESELAFK